MRGVIQSRIRRTAVAIAVVALIVFGIVWIRHARALRRWQHQHGGYRQSVVQRLLGRRETVSVEMSCRSKLSCWLVFLHEYHRNNGALPQVRIPGEDADSLHSWRIGLLTSIEYPFASRYRYDEPWYALHNKQLVDQSHELQHCPKSEHGIGTGFTNYVAVVGPNCMWREDRGVSFDEVTDDPAQTILLVEWPQSDIQFLEPRDLSVDQFMAIRANPETEWPHETQPPFLQTRGTLYMYVGTADGYVRRLPKDTPPETLKALLTIDGGEMINDPFLH